MAGFLDRVRAERSKAVRPARKSFSEPSFWSYDALRWPFMLTYALTPDKERIEANFEGYVQGAYKANGIVFACIAARQRVFSQARFQWREYTAGRPGKFFGTAELGLLERPWPGGTTGELLSRMEAVASLAGNSYETVADDKGRFGKAATGPGQRIVSMRPDWVTIVLGSYSGSPHALDTKILGFLYEPKTGGAGQKATLLLADEVSHYSPMPDPEAKFRGMSWLTPILREIEADNAATEHKGRFFKNGATPNMVVRFDKDTKSEQFDEFREKFNEAHQGAANAYKCLHPDTEVSMWDGRRVRAADVVPGDRVVAWSNGSAQPGVVTASEWQPESPIITVTTQRGRVVRTNDRHPFLLADGRWVDARDVQVGDRLVPGLGWASDDVPDTLTSHESWTLGLLVGDGCLVSTTPVISAWDEGTRARLEIGYSLVHTGKGHDYRVKGLTGRLREIGLFGKRSWEKRVPDAVMTGSAKIKGAFISGLIDADGHVSDPNARTSAEVNITSTSRDLLVDVQHVLASLGINASLSCPPSMAVKTGYGLARHAGWRLCVFGNDQAAMLERLLDLACHSKASRLAAYAGRPSKQNRSRYDRVISVEVGASERTIGIEVAEHHTHVTGGLVTHNTLFLAGGADVTVVGKDFQQMDFGNTTGKGENRIAVAAGVPASILGISEGLQGSPLNSGNFGAARRLFMDSTIWDLWSKAAPSLQTLVKAPSDRALLEVDTRFVPFMREDAADAAAILKEQMLAIESGVRSGFDPKTVVAAVVSGDLEAMSHLGLWSVQLQPPGDGQPPSLPQAV